ncbi:ABC transporter ATP-binding protein [Proteinivorax tanatarense]|uniref:ABC transporter ATP-binding protein n=1 Tax=Proteinivorax tanatarense TaxID=1260629 RepID=A0AAU7VNQ5_9FIRM
MLVDLVKKLPNLRPYYLLAVLCLVGEVLFTLIMAQSLRVLGDSAILQVHDSFYVYLGILMFSTVVLSLCLSGQTLSTGKISESITYTLRKEGTQKLIELPEYKLDEMNSGDSMSKLTNDLQLVGQFLNNDAYMLISRPLIAIVSLVYLLLLNWQLTLISIVVIPLLFIATTYLGKPISRFSKEHQDELSNMNNTTQDILGGVSIVKTFNLQNIVREKFSKQVNTSMDRGVKLAKKRAVLQSLTVGISFLPFIVTFGLGGYLTVAGSLTPGELIAFINLLNNLTFPLAQIPSHYGSYKTSMQGLKRIYDLLNEEAERKNGESFDVENASTLVEVKNLTFGYGDSSVLKNLNFKVKKGETLALVGPSGSGKSTIFKLLTGFYADYKGKINMFEKDIEIWNLDKLRSNISTVSQDTYLFPATIRENLTIVCDNYSETQLIKATNIANAHDFIKKQPNGYDTIVEEKGNNFSGGQKQRLAIARAILKNPELLLLDEATSALDTESEAIVQKALDNVMSGRTSIVIAHRLSTIVNADRILVLDNGNIVEEGSHRELLDKKGLYYNLYHKQFDSNKGGVA